MRILVLDGTAWLGGEVARAAVAAGHEVTCPARGESGPMPDGARAVRADRDLPSGLDGVTGQDWLIAHGVQEWMGERSLPLWLHDPEYAGFTSTSSAKARAAGLITRPLADTLADVLAWELAQGVDRLRGAGLTREGERDLRAEARPTGRPPGR
jgi:hypothetical protein